MLKTQNCGELRPTHSGQQVTLAGWVNRRRDQGGLIFIDLRDRWGIVQVLVNQEDAPEAHRIASEARNEYVLQVNGLVRIRPEGTANPELETGEVEVVAASIKILNTAKTPPFYINKDEKIEEITRMQYRYLDLRRPRMQENIVLRHRIVTSFNAEADGVDTLEIIRRILEMVKERS